jgi:hypothetical protein
MIGGTMFKPSAILMASLLSAVPVGIAGAADCAPHCDYIQDYGPYDLTYIQPGLFAFPICDWRGNCSPHAYYTNSGPRFTWVPWQRPLGRVTVRVRARR